MDYIILKDFNLVAPFVDHVRVIADSNKNAFGFLSAVVYEQMASKGQLWVAVNNKNELKGYLMFGGSMPTLKVFQVYSCPSTKGHGVGKALITTLKEFAKESNYHTILAKVASDLPANYFWEKLEFPICRQIKGGKTTKRIINIRAYSLEGNDLFGGFPTDQNEVRPHGPVLGRPVYALDLNLLLDVFKARKGYKKVVRIMQIGFQDGCTICVTPEFLKELERQTKNFKDDPVIRLAEAFPQLKDPGDISNTVNTLRNIVFPDRSINGKSAQNDESDLMHLAHCVAAGVGGFITRERALLRSCEKIKHQFGVAILSPDELVLDEGDLLDVESPLNSDFSFSSVSANSEIRKFLESFSARQEILDRIFTSSPILDEGVVYEARQDGVLFGVYFFQKPSKATGNAVACLYVDESCPKAIAAIDHFIEKSLRYRSGFTYRLNLFVGKEQVSTQDTLRKKGFLDMGNNFVKIICDTFISYKNWESFTNDMKSLCEFTLPNRLPTKKELMNTGICLSDSEGRLKALSWFDFETIISPRFIFNSDRNCILVPIRENFANGLIGNVKNPLSLLSSHDKALLLEKAYFRTTGKATMFRRGGIIAFYVSGRESIQELIGFARITYSDVINLDQARIKVDRQGVLSVEELAGLKNKAGEVHVFTFDNFLEFDNRVSFGRARTLGLISGSNLVSPEEIGPEKLKTLIGEAFNE